MNDVMIGDINATENLKKCRWCRESIDSNAKVCKFCQKNQTFLANYMNVISVAVSILMVLLTFIQLLMAKSEAGDAEKAKLEANIALEQAKEAATIANKSKLDAEAALGKAIDSANKAQLAKIDAQTALAATHENRKASLISELNNIISQIGTTHENWLANEGRKNAICSNIGVSPSTPHLLLEPQKTSWRVAQEASDRLASLKSELEKRAETIQRLIDQL